MTDDTGPKADLAGIGDCLAELTGALGPSRPRGVPRDDLDRAGIREGCGGLSGSCRWGLTVRSWPV